MGVACHALLDARHARQKFQKNHAKRIMQMQKESCKNMEPFPSSNFVNNQGFKNGRGRHALLGAPPRSTKLSKIV